ncbi:uncharacterized protein LOC133175826 [Saccostrea echinata]|uniref:uncharacterized protein LOC133175826 n=1 Tax=Saccostrea echinata TaxID=191078 RepID=UPI002A831657|nr:uncharacterized protein LOC133175826 [Saccostrea echinata]
MESCPLPCVPQSHIYADIDFNVRSLLLIFGGMSTIDEGDILELEDIYQLREELEILIRNVSYYHPRIRELHERILMLKTTVDKFTKQEVSIEERIRSQYQLQWDDMIDKFTDISIVCSKERERIDELEKNEIRYKSALEIKNSKIKSLEEKVATLSERNEKLSSTVSEMKEWNVTFANTKEWNLKTAHNQLAMCNAERIFFQTTHNQTIGMRMYDEWVFDKTRIQQYWDAQIIQTTHIIRNIYNIRLEAERRYLAQQYQIKMNKSETEILKFKKSYKAQLLQLQQKVAQFQAIWEKMESNCSSKHDRQRCTRLRGEFRIMVDIVVSK